MQASKGLKILIKNHRNDVKTLQKDFPGKGDNLKTNEKGSKLYNEE